jgi:plasmid stability protein
MKAITLRNLPPELDKAIRKRARDKRVSVNKAVIGLLEEHLTPGKLKRTERHHQLDHLFGSWTDADADEFDRVLDKQRTIDPDMRGR